MVLPSNLLRGLRVRVLRILDSPRKVFQAFAPLGLLRDGELRASGLLRVSRGHDNEFAGLGAGG